ncbi:MAG: LPS assembly lipoprotein LptE [Lentisphaeraceae bacterium]|nr:LPS assembly lipoprotein LptE [Lentisphaeraceae bacterium]
MKRNSFLVLAVLFLITGCGYNVGYLSHPQIKTVGIGKIKNLTDEPRLATYLRESLKERFMFDGSIKVVDADKADIIINGEVTNYTVNTAGSVSEGNREQRNGFFASIYRTTMNFNYKIKTRKQWDVQSGTATGYADYTELLDQQEEKRNSLKRASYEVSKEVVRNITEAW